MELIEALAQFVGVAPYTTALRLLGSTIGWLTLGVSGFILCSGLGTMFGVYFDVSENPLVRILRTPVTIAASLGILALAFRIAMR